MLSRAKITPGRAAYYTEVVAKGLDDYLSGSGESPGVWAGAGAAREGLAGIVTSEQMDVLFERADPCHPLSGEVLGVPYSVGEGRDKVAGWDLTLSAPKSFSALWAVAHPDLRDTLDQCHSDAVNTAIGYLERHGAFSRKGRAGRSQVDTHGLMIARFDHRTSRVGDPQRHSHLLVSNRVRCLDGIWRALDSRALHPQLKAAGVVYQAALRAETTQRVGVRWGLADRNGQADIAGVPDAVTAGWSTRRAAVLRRAAERITESEGVLGRSLTLAERRRAFETATIESRPAKTALVGDVHERWRTEATELGHHPADWVPEVVGRDVPGEVGLDGLVEVAINTLAETRSTWGRPDLVIGVAALLPPQTRATATDTLQLVERLVDEALAEPVIVEVSTPIDYGTGVPLRRDSLPIDRPHHHTRYTTTVNIEREIDVLEFATQPDTRRGQVRLTQVAEVVDDSGLSDDQQDAVERITTDGAALSCLVGPAGTGKTTTIAAAAQVWQTAGYQVRGLAVSAVAAEVLGTSLGIEADTVAKLLWEHHHPDGPRPRFRIGPGEVLIVDEASMVSTTQFHQLTRLAQNAGAKIVAVGDYRQLGAVDAGGLFQLLAHDTRAVELTGAWRFHHRWERAATIALRDRQLHIAHRYHRHGRLHRGYGDAAFDQMVQHWAALTAEGGSVVMLASGRDDADTLAQLARHHRVRAGEVEAGGWEVKGQTIGIGDHVVTLRNERRLVTTTGRWVRNGDRWTVTNRTAHGDLDVTNAERGSLRLPAGYVDEHVTLGYALTVHKAQGLTVDHGLALVDDGTSSEALYVGMTRGRASNHAYVLCDGAGADFVDIVEGVIGRDGTERSALAYLRERGREAADAADESLTRFDPVAKYREQPTAPDPPAVEVDGGIDIGW